MRTLVISFLFFSSNENPDNQFSVCFNQWEPCGSACFVAVVHSGKGEDIEGYMLPEKEEQEAHNSRSGEKFFRKIVLYEILLIYWIL